MPRSRAWPLAQLPASPWAIDNGAFSGLDAGAYVRLLDAVREIPGCLFATVPDVVGNAEATWELWRPWSRIVRSLRFRPAWVAQDGLRPDITPALGPNTALFIGGSTRFKLSPQARSLVVYAKARGAWVHMGRVNTRRRLIVARSWGCDSADGSGFSRFPNTRIPLWERWLREEHHAPRLAL